MPGLGPGIHANPTKPTWHLVDGRVKPGHDGCFSEQFRCRCAVARYSGPRRTAMDFADAPEHAAFRAEFRAWLDANLPDDLKVEDAQDQRISPDRDILVKRVAWQK